MKKIRFQILDSDIGVELEDVISIEDVILGEDVISIEDVISGEDLISIEYVIV